MIESISFTEILMGPRNKELLTQKKLDILYRLAREVRNVRGVGPSSQGQRVGQILSELRVLDGKKYDSEVLLISP